MSSSSPLCVEHSREFGHFFAPGGIDAVPSEDVLCARPRRNTSRFELSDHLPSTNDDERLATVHDGIE